MSSVPIVGCYVMHLYCQGKDHYPLPPDTNEVSGPLELTGINERECLREATERGWFVRKQQQRVFCPRCRKQYKPKDYRIVP